MMHMLAGAIALLCMARAGIRTVQADACVDQEQRRHMEAIHRARAQGVAGCRLELLALCAGLIGAVQEAAMVAKTTLCLRGAGG